ncbi:MAG: PleD family two-component system response regulator [Beijerinckiaceae bacterium]
MSAAFNHVLNTNLRILVVDDDPIQREFASVYISTPTAEVVTAPSGKEGFQALKREAFDIVLVDFDMPGMNGLEFIESLRSDSRLASLPVIMVTGHEDIATIDAAFRAGATSFVTKPVNWRLLSYQIKYVLRDRLPALAA